MESGEVEKIYGEESISGKVFFLKKTADKKSIVCLTTADTPIFPTPIGEKCYVLDSKTYEIKYEKDIAGYANYLAYSIFNADGTFFAVVTPDGKVGIIETNTGKLVQDINANIFIPEWEPGSIMLKTLIKQGDATVRAFSFDEKNERVAVFLSPLSFGNASTNIYSIKTGRLLKNIPDAALGFTADGKFLISYEGWGANVLYDANTYMFIKQITSENEYNQYKIQGENQNWSPLSSFVSSADGKYRIEAGSLSDIFIKEQHLGQRESAEIYKTTLFDNEEWVSMTPDGYYNSSPNGDEYINIRYDVTAFHISQFGKGYFHPEVIERRMKGEKDPAVVDYFGDIRLSAAPPAVMVEKVGGISKNNEVELQISVIDAIRKYNLENVCIFINGRQLGRRALRKAAGFEFLVDKNRLEINKKTEYVKFSIPVTLEPGENVIEVTADNEACYGIGTLALEAAGGAAPKPDLWIMTIGINDYKNLPANSKSGLIDLQNAVNDSDKIVQLFTGKNNAYKNVHLCRISDASPIKPTYENIKSKLNFFDKMDEDDVAVLFIASHGVGADGDFYFLPSDVSFDRARLTPDFSRCINTQDILNAINVPGRKIVFIDTCQSGSISNNTLVKTLANKSVAIFAAARSNELAQESEGYGGHFTFSINECFEENKNSAVSLYALGEYVDEEVKNLSRFGGRGKIRQHPVILIPDGLAAYTIK